MEKKILIALDDSAHSKNAVKYASSLFEIHGEMTFMLMNVQPGISGYLKDEARKSAQSNRQLRSLMEKNKQNSTSLLEGYEKQLVSYGVPSERIQTESIAKNTSVARDILAFAEEGRFDAILVGRSGVSYLKKLIVGSVTSNLLRASHVIPIWIVDNEVKSHKMIIPIDGSEGSLRVVDHLSFILGDQAGNKLTFLHVRPQLSDFCEIDSSDDMQSMKKVLDKSLNNCVDQFYSKSMEMLSKSGLKENNIELIQKDNYLFLGKTVLKEIEKNGYGTIVMGKTSGDSSEELGSVSRYIINHAENCAIWVVP